METRGVDLHQLIKKGKNIVIDLDGVEYLVDESAVDSIQRGDEKVDLTQLYDRQHYLFDVATVVESLTEKGVVDYLDKRD